MQQCNSCHHEKPETAFPECGRHTKKNGEKIIYRRKTCKSCFAGKERNRQRERDRDEFKRLMGWPATLLTVALATVVGIYQFDSVSGRNRTCTYESVYGHHSVTIDAMNMCPLTWEFEI